MSNSIIDRRVNQLINSILLTFAISIPVGEFAPVNAQANQSEQFFERGQQEFEREAETLQDPPSEPKLTIDEDRDSLELESVPTPDEELGLDDNEPYESNDEQIKIKF